MAVVSTRRGDDLTFWEDERAFGLVFFFGRRSFSTSLSLRPPRPRTAIMVKKRGSNQHKGGKPFLEWCKENGKRGEKLANEFREELPTKLAKGSDYKAKWKCGTCSHVWRAAVKNRTESVRPCGCPKCANRIPVSKTKNFLAWCEKNGERGKKLSREYIDPDRPPTAVTYGSNYKALWNCGTCSHEWRAKVFHRTKSNSPSGCPQCNIANRRHGEDGCFV